MTAVAGGPRVLVAGIGNLLRGDDGFGPAVVAALAGERLPDGVRVVELGIAGINLVQELMDGYDGLVLVDAVERQAAPGTLFVLEPLVPDPAEMSPDECRLMATDMHQTVPGPALVIARAAGALPPWVRIVGCQLGEVETLEQGLGTEVAAAVPAAVAAVHRLLAEFGTAAPPAPAATAGAALR